eukprot:4308376-Pleurochrysis_carterae.AAC.1
MRLAAPAAAVVQPPRCRVSQVTIAAPRARLLCQGCQKSQGCQACFTSLSHGHTELSFKNALTLLYRCDTSNKGQYICDKWSTGMLTYRSG